MINGVSTFEIIQALWPIAAVGLVGFAWLIRLEAKVLSLDDKSNTQAQEKVKLWEKLEEMSKSMTAVLVTLSRMEGRDQGRSEATHGVESSPQRIS